MTLEKLGRKYGTDKVDHGFLPFYESFFGPIREQVERLLEIGIANGASHRMWLDYFPNAQVWGMDAPGNVPMRYGDHNRWPQDARFRAYLGNQAERSHLKKLLPSGPFDIVIDDGGHTMEQQQVSLGVLFPAVKPGGYYVVEDLHTSFMDEIHISDGRSYPTNPDDLVPAWDHLRLLGIALELGTTRSQDGGAERHLGGFFSQSEGEPAACAMTLEEQHYITLNTARVEVFDRDDDHKHMTAVIQKGAADG